ncbi:ModD protein [Sulfurimonas crateris]|uniref:Putative pyrophosphorylase ModD n=1 Tax=Sulfurimonas crateris TaxID=2574727 RepID=A0A4U2Z8M3_9BACT|nr:ModD protein [Sulfurimonas crateris]TKI69321.1 ModD protein [Sulfurimonas crateris]
MDLLFEDTGYFDLTTYGLRIGDKKGVMSFSPKAEIVLCGADEVEKILKKLNIKHTFFKNNGDRVMAKETILECKGDAASLHKAWKISQNIFEYMSGIATYTNTLIKSAKAINPSISVSTTRKNFPGAKELMLKAVMCGGGAPHRLGLYDSVLIFEQHLNFFNAKEELEQGFKELKHNFIERKIAVEVESFEQASYFASLGADILQCEKMDFKTLKSCVGLKQKHPTLLLSATGGINEKNIAGFAACGVDFIVTSSPYHAKPLDIKVTIKETN